MRLNEQQAQLGGRAALIHHEDRADALAVALGNPAALALGIELAQEFGDDVGHQRLEQRAPAVLLAVEHAVALDDPAHVARPMRAQCDLALRAIEDRVRLGERFHQRLAVRHRQRREHLAGRTTRSFVEHREGAPAFGR